MNHAMYSCEMIASYHPNHFIKSTLFLDKILTAGYWAEINYYVGHVQQENHAPEQLKPTLITMNIKLI